MKLRIPASRDLGPPSVDSQAPGHLLQSFFDWFHTLGQLERPWLVLGKGPSFAQRHRYDLDHFHLLSLNHAVREQPVLAAHMIDLDVVQACGDVLERQAQVVVMPWYPHVQNKVGTRNLAELVPTVPVLARLADEGRVLWYDLSTAATRHGDGPVVQATYFSAEAALSLLALAGVKEVRSLGIDGGASYSADFRDLSGRTLLANGHPSFDLQFQGIARTIVETGVDFVPLDLSFPLRVYAVYAPREALATAVLAYSIRKRTSLTARLAFAPEGSELPSDDPALVLSPRLQCFADLRRLWIGLPAIDGIAVPALAPEARGNTAPISLAVAGDDDVVMGDLASALRVGITTSTLEAYGLHTRADLPSGWQPTSRYVPGRTRFAHFADDGSEPWISRTHPAGHLWVQDLIDAVHCGGISRAQVEDEVWRGHVRPSLLYQLDHAAVEPSLLPRRARALDHGFHPPAGKPVGVSTLTDNLALVVGACRRAASRRVREQRAAWRSG